MTVAADHKITVEFLGTDSQEIADLRNRYAVSCSCLGIKGRDSLSHGAADLRIRKHLDAVGLTESFTQQP